MNRNKKNVMLITILIVLLSLIITLTVNGVEIVEVKDVSQVLSNVEYLGVSNKPCYHMTCTGLLLFKSEGNTYQLTGHKHEIETLLVGSKYNIYYDGYTKSILRYEFGM